MPEVCKFDSLADWHSCSSSLVWLDSWFSCSVCGWWQGWDVV